MRFSPAVVVLLFLGGCPDDVVQSDASFPDASEPARDAEIEDAVVELPDVFDAGVVEVDAGEPRVIEVLVRLDSAPAPGVRVVQGGTENYLFTDADSRVFYPIDPNVIGVHYVLASHPEARIRAAQIRPNEQGPIIIDLFRYDTSDYEAYVFQDPGEPNRSPTTAQCGHCHQTITADWFASPHRTSASNPRVRDLYFGPGGVRELVSGSFGGCADCHAPGIDGQLGGRDLGEASERAEQYGVHCDVCHRVDRIDLERDPGVAGRLVMTRPSEEGPVSLGAGGRLPLTFGPSHDTANPRMGSVQRDHFRTATFCAGCHQLDQAALLPNTAIDPARWPSGKIPVQSTYEEWRAGPFGELVPCQECHMPPDPMVLNGGDLQFYPFSEIGVQGGFVRAPGSTRRHVFLGPRAQERGFVELAAALFVQKTIAEDVLTARVTVKNVGAGHALPTGEPLRTVILLVEARCGERTLGAIDGDVVPDFGGYVDRKSAGDDFTTWPTAQVGDQIRVVRRPGGYFDYVGFGPFGDGRFDAQAKGMPLEAYVAASTVTAIASDGVITAEPPLPAGDVAYLVRGDAYAGAPGFAFARVLVGADGRREVPHYAAVDVASDNRILPSGRFSSTHVFRAECSDPVVHARLIHRPYPRALAIAQGWAPADQIISEVRR